MVNAVIKQLFKLSLFVIVLNACLTMPLMAGWKLEWIDTFDGSGVNRGNWTSQTQANYNAEVQCYTDDDTSINKNYDVSNGTLKIIARKGANNCIGLGGIPKTWTSGRLNSKDKREFLYGRIEARIKLNDIKGGSWPAFWMLENRINEQPIRGDNDFVGWPNPGAGEIDVWEWYSNNPSTYITNFFNTNNCGNEVRYSYPGGAPDVQQWHDYAIEWDENTIKFMIDDVMVTSHDVSNCAQYKEPMFILLNVAMGGTLGGSIDPSLTTATMEVDYVAHCKASNSNNLTRCNPNTPSRTVPLITSNPSRSIMSDSFYNYTLIATDADGDNLTLSAPTIPSWLTFNSANGLLSGVPSIANQGNHNVTLSVNDGSNLVNQAFTIVVSVPVATIPQVPVNNAPTLSISSNLQAQTGIRYQNTIVANDIDNNSLILSAPAIPSWLMFNSSTGLLSGTPSNDDIGSHNITLRVSDGIDVVNQSIIVTVIESLTTEPNIALIFTSNPLQDGAVGTEYRYTVTSDNGNSENTQIAATTLPNWITFNSQTNSLIGTPNDDDIGIHKVIIVITNGANSTTQEFDITIASADVPVTGTAGDTSGGGGNIDLFFITIFGFLLGIKIVRTSALKNVTGSLAKV
ncbi:MAG: beta-glucanase (GH16 family), partial [Cocleimonas sp.]